MMMDKFIIDIFKNYNMIGLLAIFLLSLTEQLDISLPKLIQTHFQDTSLPNINVTIGEKFSIPLPTFDAPWIKEHFAIYEVTKEDFNSAGSNKSKQIVKQEQDRLRGKEVGIDYLPFECTLKAGKAYIKTQIKSIQQQYSKSRNSVWQQNQFVHLSFKSLLYILKVGSSQLVTYLYNSASLDKITSLNINSFRQQEQFVANPNISTPVIALNSKETLLYLFTSLGIWQIPTKTILTEIKQISDISGFNSKRYEGIDKVVHGQEGTIVALKRYSGVFIIPESDSSAKQPSKYKTIKSFGNQTQFFPQDIRLIGDILYVLDYKKGVYVYILYKDGQFKQKFKIQFKPFAGNVMFQIYQNTIFINFNDNDGSKIVQINFNLQQQTNYLVRYIKSSQYISALNVVNSLTSYEGQPYHAQYREDSFDTFLFLTLNFDDIEIYPFNIDPRVINEPYNAVKLKGNSIRKIFHVRTDFYLLITNEEVKYVRIAIEKPVIACRTRRLQQQSSSKYFKIALTSNISSCQHKDHELDSKKYFHSYCSYKTNYFIHLGDPQQSYLQRVKLYSFVFGAFVLFIGGLVCLMQWRKNKMMLLRRLKDEIMRFRNSHKKMQPFSQEQVQQKDIQIEVPQFRMPSQQDQ